MQRDLLHAAALVHGRPRRKLAQLDNLGAAHQLMQEHVAARRRGKRGPGRIAARLMFG